MHLKLAAQVLTTISGSYARLTSFNNHSIGSSSHLSSRSFSQLLIFANLPHISIVSKVGKLLVVGRVLKRFVCRYLLSGNPPKMSVVNSDFSQVSLFRT